MGQRTITRMVVKNNEIFIFPRTITLPYPGDKDPFEGGGGNQGAQYLRDSIIMQYLPIFEDFREVYLQSLLRWIIKDKY